MVTELSVAMLGRPGHALHCALFPPLNPAPAHIFVFPPAVILKHSADVLHLYINSVQSLSRVQLCDPMDRSTTGLPVHHQLPEFTQTHVQVGDAIQPLSSPSPPAFNLSQHHLYILKSLVDKARHSHKTSIILTKLTSYLSSNHGQFSLRARIRKPNREPTRVLPRFNSQRR